MKEVIGGREEASAETIDQNVMSQNDHILVVDDSSVARNQVKRVCEQIGIECTLLKDGQEAWDHLCALVAEGTKIEQRYSMIISDVEMPRMDGYTLATKIKADPNMKHIYLILHTSLSGVFNTSMVQKSAQTNFSQVRSGLADAVHPKTAESQPRRPRLIRVARNLYPPC